MDLHQLIAGGLTVGVLAAIGCYIYRDSKRMELAVKKSQEVAPEPAKTAPTFPNAMRQPSLVGEVRSVDPSALRAKPARAVSTSRRRAETRRDDDALNPLSPLHPLNSYAEPVRSEPVSCSRDDDSISRHTSSWSSSCDSSSGSSSYDSGSSCSSSSSGFD